VTNDEWTAIERPYRLAIMEHCGMTTKQVNIRLPHSSHELMTELQERLGMTQVQVIIVALEHLALVKGVPQPQSVS
jgi:antitoxin component of RelBE/YafQ-DinJ toxin-antitoxin module